MKAIDKGKNGLLYLPDVIKCNCPSNFGVIVKECEDAHYTKQNEREKCTECWNQEAD